MKLARKLGLREDNIYIDKNDCINSSDFSEKKIDLLWVSVFLAVVILLNPWTVKMG